MENDLNFLSSRAGFNTALRHFKSVNSYVADMEEGYNLADLLQEDLNEGLIKRDQVRAIVNALLIDKFGYAYRSFNIEKSLSSADGVASILGSWNNLDIVVLYHHPLAGIIVINPAREEMWEDALPLMLDELMVVYVGPLEGQMDDKTLDSTIDDIIKVLSGRKVKGKGDYIGKKKRKVPVKTYEPEKVTEQSQAAKTEQAGVSQAVPAQEPVARPAGRVQLTPKVAVLVTNELFHNGNVEAWKKIIDSYKSKYPQLDVLIWYENERINDINALFKWGKVKHGTPILFSVRGENIKDVSKLKRYLFEGASPRFETFLKHGPDVVLDLF